MSSSHSAKKTWLNRLNLIFLVTFNTKLFSHVDQLSNVRYHIIQTIYYSFWMFNAWFTMVIIDHLNVFIMNLSCVRPFFRITISWLNDLRFAWFIFWGMNFREIKIKIIKKTVWIMLQYVSCSCLTEWLLWS